jgi:hypothetical protein
MSLRQPITAMPSAFPVEKSALLANTHVELANRSNSITTCASVSEHLLGWAPRIDLVQSNCVGDSQR